MTNEDYFTQDLQPTACYDNELLDIEEWLNDGDDDDDEPDFDCGFIVGEGCTLGGTEECDFECPYRDQLIASPYYPDCDLLGHEANDPDAE